jgi:tape measure domain-containing protein
LAVTAAQLEANISVTGGDEAVDLLNAIAEAVDALIEEFSDMPSLSIGDSFAEAASAIADIGSVGEEAASGLEDVASGLESASNQSASFMDVINLIDTGLTDLAYVLGDTSDDAASFTDTISLISNYMQDIGSAITDAASGPMQSFISGIQNMSSSVMQFGSDAISNAQSGLSGFMDTIGNSTSGFGDFVNTLGMGIMNFQMIGMQATQTAQALLGPAVSAETMQTAFDTLMGSTQKANAELSQLATFAAKTPFKTMDIDQAASQLIGFGVNAQNVIPDITAIGDALSAVGKGSTANLDSIVNIFGKIQLAGKITGADMTQFSDDGINAWGVLEKQTGKTQAQLQAMISAGLLPAGTALNDLTKGIEASPLYSGGMAKQSETTAGLISTLQSNWNQLMVAFGTPIIKSLEGSLGNLTNALSNPAFQAFAGAIGQGIANALQAITSNVHIATPILAGLAAIIATFLVPAVWGLASGVIAATWPFLLIGAAVAGVVAVFQHFYETNAGFRSFINGLIQGLQQAWNAISANFIPVMKQVGTIIQTDVMPVLKSIGEFLSSTFKPVWDQLVTTFKTQIMPIFAQMAPIMEPLKTLLGAIGMIIGTIVIVALGLLVGAITGVVKAFAGMLPGIIQAVGGIIQFFGGLIQFVSGIVAFFVDLFTGNFSKLGTDLGVIWDGIANMFKGVLNVIGGLFSAAWGFISGLVSGFVEGIVKFFTGLWDDLVGHSIIPDMINGIINWFQQLPGRALAFVENLVNSLTTTLGGLGAKAITWAEDMMNGFVQTILSYVGAVGNAVARIASAIAAFLHFSKPDVGPLVDVDNWMPDFGDTLAKGLGDQINKIQAPALKLASQLALSINPNVAALPAGISAIPASIGASSPQSAPIIVQNYIDGKQITNATMTRMVKSTRISGPIRSNLS